MLLKRLKLVNYGGIYNGLGLKEIEIDFTKCQHRIILIKGDNGSGKSTIESALKPLPDDNAAFIAGENAYKEIEYIDEISGTIYSIRFEHEIAGNTRKSRGFISKSCGGFITQLNPSGNITSCKDVIYDELQLDPNFITLSQLSATKRGIADLRPAERKKYVNSILENTDAYNDMYKTLSKKASAYKGMVQSITAKLDTIGNVTQLEEAIKCLDTQIQDIEDMIERHNEIMNKEKGMLQSTDPDNKLRERIEYLNTTLAEYQEKRATNDKELRKIYVKYPELATLTITPNMISELNAKVIEMSNLASSYKSKIAVLIESRRIDSEELQVKTAKLKSINSAGTLYEVKKLKQELNKKKNNIESRWGRVIDINSITSSEFLSIYEIILEMIDIICSTNIVLDVDGEYRKTNLAIKEIEDKIDEIVNINNRISLYEDKVYILEQRPATCTDNTCPFIADAIDAKKMLDKFVEDRRKTKESLFNLSKNKDSLNDYLFVIEKSRQLRNMYNANIRVLRLLNFGFDTFESTIHELKTKANMIKSILRGVLDYTNDIEEYKKITQSLSDIENKFHALSSQEDFINMITTDIAKLEYQIAEDNNTIEKLNTDLTTLDKEFTRITGIISTYTSILEYNKIINECMEAIKILNDEIDKLKKLNIKDDPKDLKICLDITPDSYASTTIDNSFTVFKSINEILYLIYVNENKSIISYDLNKQKKLAEIKNIFKTNITNFKHFLDEKKKRDLIMTMSLEGNNIKVFNVSNWECICQLNNVNSSGWLESSCFLNNNEDNYIVTSNYNNLYNPEAIKVFDFKGNKIKEIKNSNY
jgi:uncharacterized coiled-coil protein SlyX